MFYFLIINGLIQCYQKLQTSSENLSDKQPRGVERERVL